MSSGRVQTSFKASKERNYTPTTAELNEAIEDFLHEKPKATTAAVRSALIKDHKTWVIPERRLNKFVKRQKAGKPVTTDDDTTAGFKSFFTIKSTKAAESAPAKKKHTPTLSNGKPIVVTKKTKPAAKAEEPAPVEKIEEKPESTEKLAAYVDDNDGKKTGALEVCEGCIIL